MTTKNLVIVYFGPQIAQIYADFRPPIFAEKRHKNYTTRTTKKLVIVYFDPQIAQIYADFRPPIFADIRSSRIFKDSFLRVRKNKTNKGRIDKKYKKLFSKNFLK
jgi:hypothetical protein